jgi:predicted MFS family arabinose efflux permease
LFTIHSSAGVIANQRLLTPSLILTMAVASGVAVANAYYNQPMLAEMARTFGSSPHEIGLVATATQIGYGVGMPIFLPLGDLVERRRLIVALFLAVGGALAGAALATNLRWLVGASFLIGVTTVIAQIMIPAATDLARPAEQGRVIGKIMTGVLLGILLARTVSGTLSQYFGWRSMFWMAAVLAWIFAGVLRFVLPPMPAHRKTTYGALIRSLWTFVQEHPELRQVSLIAGMFFAAFSAFWTTLVFLLETPPYHLGSQAAGLFGLVGAISALVAPAAGHLSDKRGSAYVITLATLGMLLAFAIFWALPYSLWALVAGVIVLDAAVQGAQVANQSSVFALRPDARSRINTIYMLCYFGGASLGSFVGSWAWGRWHWAGVCVAAIGFIVVAGLTVIARDPYRAPARVTA